MDGKSRKVDPAKGVVNTPLCVTEPRAPLRSNLDDPEDWELPCSVDESVCWDEVHRTDLVACCPTIKCGTAGCTGSCPLAAVEFGYTSGKTPATCEICGKTFPRPNATLSDSLPAKSERKKGKQEPKLLLRHVTPQSKRLSRYVSWSDSPREHSEANGEDTVMEDGTETHHAEINKKVKANDKLRSILTNMPEEHRTLIYGDSFKSKMESFQILSVIRSKMNGCFH